MNMIFKTYTHTTLIVIMLNIAGFKLQVEDLFTYVRNSNEKRHEYFI